MRSIFFRTSYQKALLLSYFSGKNRTFYACVTKIIIFSDALRDRENSPMQYVTSSPTLVKTYYQCNKESPCLAMYEPLDKSTATRGSWPLQVFHWQTLFHTCHKKAYIVRFKIYRNQFTTVRVHFQVISLSYLGTVDNTESHQQRYP